MYMCYSCIHIFIFYWLYLILHLLCYEYPFLSIRTAVIHSKIKWHKFLFCTQNFNKTDILQSHPFNWTNNSLFLETLRRSLEEFFDFFLPESWSWSWQVPAILTMTSCWVVCGERMWLASRVLISGEFTFTINWFPRWKCRSFINMWVFYKSEINSWQCLVFRPLGYTGDSVSMSRNCILQTSF